MRTAVLPFNAAANTSPALARQLSAFAAETIRSVGGQINSINYLAQIEQDGQQRAAFVNVSDTVNERSFFEPLFSPGPEVDPENVAEVAFDGLLTETDGTYAVVYRGFSAKSEEPLFSESAEFTADTVFPVLRTIIAKVAELAQVELPEQMKNLDFGTDSGQAFLKFLEGYDAFTYVQQANGAVAMEFSPDGAFGLLQEALKIDADFVAPYEATCALARSCAMFRIGTFENAEKFLKEAGDLVPADFKASYSLGELYGAVGLHAQSSEAYEKALKLHEAGKNEAQEDGRTEEWLLEQASIYSRIGLAQMNANMPVNAELNFRKAIELESEDKPSLNLLAQVLGQTNRAHEIPALWKQQLERQPQDAEVHAKYAISLYQVEREKEAVEVFENALTTLEDPIFVKRFYAPLLAQKGDLDRAMDFYEDCIDVAPTDVPLLVEYARTLSAAERDFEVPAILENILQANPDPNTRAEVLAWKTELTEPKRAEAVKNAEEKMSKGDFDGAIKDLRPLRNWLADYWKLWAVLAAAHNRVEEYEEAKDAAERLIGLFPGCEPAYAELMAALQGLGENEQAFNLMQYAANQIPNSLGIQVNLGLAAKRAGQSEFARNHARQLREALGRNEELEPVLREMES